MSVRRSSNDPGAASAIAPKAGEVSVLCGAPYGYRYIRKTRDAPALYETDAAEAEVVRLAYDKYTVEGLSIGAIARFCARWDCPRDIGRPAGSDQSCGRCCATRRTKVRPASTRRRWDRGRR